MSLPILGRSNVPADHLISRLAFIYREQPQISLGENRLSHSPSRGYFVSRVELGSNISKKFKLMNEQEATDLRERENVSGLMPLYQVRS